MRDGDTLWLVGQYRPATDEHEIVGIFSTRERALAACRDAHYWLGPLSLDEAAPDETLWPGAEYPRAT